MILFWLLKLILPAAGSGSAFGMRIRETNRMRIRIRNTDIWVPFASAWAVPGRGSPQQPPPPPLLTPCYPAHPVETHPPYISDSFLLPGGWISLLSGVYTSKYDHSLQGGGGGLNNEWKRGKNTKEKIVKLREYGCHINWYVRSTVYFKCIKNKIGSSSDIRHLPFTYSRRAITGPVFRPLYLRSCER